MVDEVASTVLEAVPAAHWVQLEAPPKENVPATHWVEAPPEQENPAVQSTQAEAALLLAGEVFPLGHVTKAVVVVQ